MAQYFDRDFFKFFMGFVTIVAVSLIIIIATRIYDEKLVVAPSDTNTANVIDANVGLK